MAMRERDEISIQPQDPPMQRRIRHKLPGQTGLRQKLQCAAQALYGIHRYRQECRHHAVRIGERRIAGAAISEAFR